MHPMSSRSNLRPQQCTTDVVSGKDVLHTESPTPELECGWKNESVDQLREGATLDAHQRSLARVSADLIQHSCSKRIGLYV